MAMDSQQMYEKNGQKTNIKRKLMNGYESGFDQLLDFRSNCRIFQMAVKQKTNKSIDTHARPVK